MSRLGVFGGTFDPVHLGHLRAAENARESLELAEVIFVPAGRPPHRPSPDGSAFDRYAMVALATAFHPAFVASDVELATEAPSYTVATLEALRGRRPQDDLVLIVGSDTYPEMSGWKEAARVRALCSVAVVTRPGEAGAPAPASEPGVAFVPGAGLPISASQVRQSLREGRSIRYLVPDGVADYIAKRRLYR
jgi:nicotinate-nucleotide adenylyltransferase